MSNFVESNAEEISIVKKRFHDIVVDELSRGRNLFCIMTALELEVVNMTDNLAKSSVMVTKPKILGEDTEL